MTISVEKKILIISQHLIFWGFNYTFLSNSVHLNFFLIKKTSLLLLIKNISDSKVLYKLS